MGGGWAFFAFAGGGFHVKQGVGCKTDGYRRKGVGV